MARTDVSAKKVLSRNPTARRAEVTSCLFILFYFIFITKQSSYTQCTIDTDSGSIDETHM